LAFFVFFCVYWVFNVFFSFGFVCDLFSGQTKIFGSVHGGTKNFRLT
jgi:hypothetical protein